METLTAFNSYNAYYTLFTADYVSIMDSLVFNGSAMLDRQCVNITILDDDVRESSIIRSQPEVFRVLLRSSDAAQLGVQTSLVSIEDDDCKLNITLVCVRSL